MSIVYTRIPETDPALIARARECGVADLHEGLGPTYGRMALMSPRMRPLNRGLRIAGPAVTAYNYPGDNLMIHKALQLVQPGQVLVFTNGGGVQGALWGEMAATFAKARGVEGIVVDGAIRDTDALVEMSAPVWHTAISPSHPEKGAAGAVNIPVVVDGVQVRPGDIIVADGDGVLAVPRRMLAAAVDAAEARRAREVELAKAIAQGATLYDLTGMEKTFQALKIDVRERSWESDQQEA